MPTENETPMKDSTTNALTFEQYQQLMILLQQSNKDMHTANQVSIGPVQATSLSESHPDQGNHFAMNCSSSDRLWILDT